MNSFLLTLKASFQSEQFAGVTSFVGEDDSGSFGIQAGHARMMTSLVFGLARFRTVDGSWHFVALPGAILYFSGDELTLNTRRYLIGNDYEKILQALLDTLAKEEQELSAIKHNLHRIEDFIMKHMLELERK